MSARTLIAAGVILALAAPIAATARTGPTKPAANQVAKTSAAKQTAKKVAKNKSTPRVLCICFSPRPFPPPPQLTEEERKNLEEAWQRQHDQDLIDHGLEPVYGTTNAQAPTAE